MAAARLWNDAEGIADGTTVTTSENKPGNNWDTASIGGASTLTHSTTHAASGNTAIKVVNAAGQNCYVAWSTAHGTQTEEYGSVYFWIAANPTSTVRLVNLFDGSTRKASIQLNTSGTVSVVDSGSLITTSTSTLVTSNWNRIDYHVLCSASVGVVDAKLYLGGVARDTFTATETITLSSANTGTQITEVRFGVSNSPANGQTFWMDGHKVSTDGYPGPGLLEQTADGVSTASSTTAVTLPGASKTGNLILVAAQTTSSVQTVSSVTDDKSNTYTRVDGASSAALGDTELWQAVNITSSSSPVVTVHFSVATGNAVIVREYRNLAVASPLDQHHASANAASTSVTSGASGTTAMPFELLIGVAGDLTASVTFTPGASWNDGWNNAGAGTGKPCVYMADQMVNATGAQTFTATASSSVANAGIVASYFCQLIDTLTGTAAGAGSASSTLSQGSTLTGTANGAGSASSTLAQGSALTGTAAAGGAATGALAQAATLTGTAAGRGDGSGLLGDLTVLGAVSAAAHGGASATLTQAADLSGIADALGSGSADLLQASLLSGIGAALGDGSGLLGDLLVMSALTGGGRGDASGSLGQAAQVAGDAAGTGSGNADPLQTLDLTGTGDGVGGAVGLLALLARLAGIGAGIGSGIGTPTLTAMGHWAGLGAGAGAGAGSLLQRALLGGASGGMGDTQAFLAVLALLHGAGAGIGDAAGLVLLARFYTDWRLGSSQAADRRTHVVSGGARGGSSSSGRRGRLQP